MSKKDKTDAGLPTREALRQYILDNAGSLSRREIARAFGVKGQDQTKLRILLRQMAEEEGEVEEASSKNARPGDSLPMTGLIEITGIDPDGEMRAKPVEWTGRGPAPQIYVLDKKRSESYLNPGDKVLARLRRTAEDAYEAKILKTPEEKDLSRVVGVFKSAKGGGYVYPADKKIKEDYFIPQEFIDAVEGGLHDGDLVVAEKLPATSKHPRAKNPVRIAERLGRKDDPRFISLIAIHSHGIPTVFPQEALAEAEKMEEPGLEDGRVDIRNLPLVTIDGLDARDFDDAVFAEPDTDPKNPGGWHLIVAIADVSYYVRPGSPLDKMAYERGNSSYFADRVVPMLPERLSNDLCSLRPRVNRACLAAHLWIDKDADLIGHKFFRGLMRSEARLTYEQVEAAHLGEPDDMTGPLMDRVIRPLYMAYSLLKHAREKRGALEIDLPERKAVINEKGEITAIIPRQRLLSHQLVEEFMILANVAAAKALEEKKAPCIYRVHPAPAYDKLESTREFLKEFGYTLPRGDEIHPRNFNHILKTSAEKADKNLIHTVLLRTQGQAVYSPDNIGHFGLALEKYAHFTSPIRRYADLLVHRSLVRSHRLGDGPLTEQEADNLHDIGDHISATERRSMLAERDVMDRFTAQYLSANIGKTFMGRVSGVTRFGLFVVLDETGADGIVPIRSLPRDYYVHDEKRHALVGKDSGRTYRLAQTVAVRLIEADPLRGSTVFALLEDGADPGAGSSPRGRGNRPPGNRRRDGGRPKGGKDRKGGKKRRR